MDVISTTTGMVESPIQDKTDLQKLEINITNCKEQAVEILKIHEQLASRLSTSDAPELAKKDSERAPGPNRIVELSYQIDDIKLILADIKKEIDSIGALF